MCVIRGAHPGLRAARGFASDWLPKRERPGTGFISSCPAAAVEASPFSFSFPGLAASLSAAAPAASETSSTYSTARMTGACTNAGLIRYSGMQWAALEGLATSSRKRKLCYLTVRSKLSMIDMCVIS